MQVRVNVLNAEKGQKQVSQVFDEWTEGLDFGPVSAQHAFFIRQEVAVIDQDLPLPCCITGPL